MLTQTAEYALRAICALAARPGQTVPATELASQASVPPPYLAKIMQQLASTDLVTGRRGIGGGYTLSADPATVTALDVIKAVGPIRQPRSEGKLEMLGDGFKSMHRAVDRAAAGVLESLQGVTIRQIVQDLDAIRQEEDLGVAVVSAAMPLRQNGIAG